MTQSGSAGAKRRDEPDPGNLRAWPRACPTTTPSPFTSLFLEQGELPLPQAQALVGRLEQSLAQMNIEYESKRASGRLAPLRLELVPPGFWGRWDRQRLERNGGTLEQYKHPCLINDLEFHRVARGASTGFQAAS
ncbi:MAG: GH3 auxin-responsive promoter family protein [Gemmataceae bacterium]